ncbi:MAG TPA: hypothetical protein VKU00_08185 [Chthonomonadaceae bacterium]|nr:hypothetical protein [Chthonomonadaceae bacterium]
MERERVLPIATAILDRLASACHKASLAGALRRGQADVADVDLVCIPIHDADLFGEEMDTFSALDGVLDALQCEGVLTAPSCDGNRRMTFHIPLLENLPLELTLTRPALWGPILALRTGPEAFVHRLLTQRSAGGLMPDPLLQIEGALWCFSNPQEAQVARKVGSALGGSLLPCPTEADYFQQLRLPYLPPDQRNAESLCRLCDTPLSPVVYNRANENAPPEPLLRVAENTPTPPHHLVS